MNPERDERWAYVALAVLAVAYLIYRYVGPDGFGGVRISLPEIDFGRFGKTLPYLFAPLFAVLSEIYRRRRARVAREDWENRVRTEGFLRQQENVAVRFSDGASGEFQGDLRLTRVALYVLDRSWRREPTRLAFAQVTGEESVVRGVDIAAGKAPELSVVRIQVGGAAKFRMEFVSSEAQAWRSDLTRLLGGPRAAAKPEERSRE